MKYLIGFSGALLFFAPAILILDKYDVPTLMVLLVGTLIIVGEGVGWNLAEWWAKQ